MPARKSSKKGDKKAARPSSTEYTVVLRANADTSVEFTVTDGRLYPKAVAWNRLLATDRGRGVSDDDGDDGWHGSALDTLVEIAATGGCKKAELERFVAACAAEGLIQIELTWQRENLGWAARIFPWETVLGMATKPERMRLRTPQFTVVRHLSRSAKSKKPVESGDPVFAVSRGAEDAGFDTGAERLAIGAALERDPQLLHFSTVSELGEQLGAAKPPIVHLVMLSGEDLTEFGSPKEDPEIPGAFASAIASHRPSIVALSSCNTGRRFAPHAIAEGAELAIGFHGEVADASVPVFFGAFYRAWHEQETKDPLGALRAGLAANRAQPQPSALGIVTLWSASSLIPQPAPDEPRRSQAEMGKAPETKRLSRSEIAASLQVTCQIEGSLNYSILHNSRGGLFKRFDVTKIQPGTVDRLEVTVRLDTGFDRPAACHFFATLPEHAVAQLDLAAGATLPLGSQLLRQRGEILLGTVEVDIRCGDTPVFHCLHPIRILPCDEWRDDQTGRHLLPSFIFPRDAAVREILGAAQPFLRALCDDPRAGFGGYFSTFTGDPAEAARLQVHAIWAALQSVWRLDYASPPPAYTLASQRLRTPEEILRARRATCIELALLLASCWEHIDLHPVIFLTANHALAGYWTDFRSPADFLSDIKKMLDAARPAEGSPDSHGPTGGRESGVMEPWMLAEPHHLAAIQDAIDKGRLVPVEATHIPLQEPFGKAIDHAKDFLSRQSQYKRFDGMLEVRTAREKGVTPLAIISQGPAA